MKLVCCITDNYLTKSLNYFDSLKIVKSVKIIVICVGFEIPKIYKDFFDFIDFRTMNMPDSHSFNIIQHGPFLDTLSDDEQKEVIILTDTDVLAQRDFTKRELIRFSELKDYEISTGINSGFYDTLGEEASRIRLGDHEKFLNDETRDLTLCNSGTMIALGSVFGQIREKYEQNYKEFYSLTDHRSRCQFLINWCVHMLDIDIIPLCPSVHTNGHFGMPPGCKVENNKLYYRNKLILFRHAI